jgi:succinate-semialdehyde dehydrogenase/glutarate-semialdehyde dehydrogenase
MQTLPNLWFEPSLWLNGEWTHSAHQREIVNPATAQPLASVALADPATLVTATAHATRIQPAWQSVSAFERGDILKRTAALLLTRKEDLARIITLEQGKPLAQAAAEVDYAAGFFQWFGEEARRHAGRISPHPDATREFRIETRPVGVSALITPWNFPLAQGAKKLAAALAAGCTALWKPSELTPLTALAIAPILTEAGLPRGVVQILPATGPDTFDALVGNPEIRHLSLTGSTATGKSVMERAARSLQRVSLELGGNAPFLVLDDANITLAADHLVRLKLLVSGQVCVTANRILVHKAIHRSFLDALSARLAAASIGDGLTPTTDAGPLIHHQACHRVASLRENALANGATLISENCTHSLHPALRAGSFFAPAILDNVPDHATAAQTEIFGPLFCVTPFDQISEAIARANKTSSGLAGYVYGADSSRALATASALEVGIVGINEWRPLKPEIPFGGIKESGIGLEGGHEGMNDFLTTQVISTPKPAL